MGVRLDRKTELSLQEFMDFTEGKTTQPDQNTTQNTSPVHNQPLNNQFLLSQDDYIEYLVYARNKQSADRKLTILWLHFVDILTWLIKFVLGAILLLAVFFGIYFLVWFMQNSLYFYRLNIPTIP